MKFSSCVYLAAFALGACGPQRQPQEAVNNSEAPVLPAPSAPPAIENSAPAREAPKAPAAEAPKPANRPSLVEPEGPIDPKSVEAAGQVVQHYGALIEENRLLEAARLWRDPKAGQAFEEELHPGTHLKIGDLGETEGAAGSIYTTVPVTFYGDTFSRDASIILRRVNDVPGSTEAERHWHIERIEMK